MWCNQSKRYLPTKMDNENICMPGIFIILLMVAVPASPQTAGKMLLDWSEGFMDIHHINTGRGNSTFFVLPDGTTMLVDAGAANEEPPIAAPA